MRSGDTRSPAPPILAGEEGGAFRVGELAPVAGGEVGGEAESADGDAEEAEGWVAGGSGHFADLAVAAFVEGEFEPAGWDILAEADGWVTGRKVGVDVLGLGWESFAAFYNNAGAELLQGGLGNYAFHLGPVSAGVGIFGIEEFGVQSGFIGKKK